MNMGIKNTEGRYDKSRKFNALFLFLIYVILAAYVLAQGYFYRISISPDSTAYLMAARGILSGHGYHFMYMHDDYTSWFSTWPIGYPFLIAVMAFITHINVLLASKLLTILILGLFVITFFVRFRSKAWVYGIVLLNGGFVLISPMTWSEIPFMLFLLWFSFCLSDILYKEDVHFIKYVLLVVCAIANFLCRYFGAVLIGVMGVLLLQRIVKNIRKRERIQEYSAISIRLAICMFIIFFAEAGYLFVNRYFAGNFTGNVNRTFTESYYSLTINLVKAIITEVWNVFSLLFKSGLRVLQIIRVPSAVGYMIGLVVAVGMFLFIYRQLRTSSGWDDITHNFWYSEDGLFIEIAIVYYICFIIVRYHSTMDPFGYRYFEPASLLIEIAFIELLVQFDCNIQRNLVVAVVFCAILTVAGSTVYTICKGSSGLEKGFHAQIDVMTNRYAKLPDDTNVFILDTTDIDKLQMIFGNTRVFSDLDTLEDDLNSKHIQENEIYVDRESLKSMIDIYLTPEEKEWKFWNELYRENAGKDDVKPFVKFNLNQVKKYYGSND